MAVRLLGQAGADLQGGRFGRGNGGEARYAYAKDRRADPSALTENPANLATPPGYKGWADYLRSKIGPPPQRMHDPHAHHILFKEGNGLEQKALVKEGQEILRRHGIDPIYGTENLVWAPNRVAEQHSLTALQHVLNMLRKVEDSGRGRKGLIAALKKLGLLAARRAT